MLKGLLFSWLCVSTVLVYGQTPPDSTLTWPLPKNEEGGSETTGRVDLKDPSNMSTEVVYDPETDTYIMYRKVGNTIDYRNPIVMTSQEYQAYVWAKSRDDFWVDKAQQSTQQNQGVEFPIEIKSKVFETIFGEGGINIKPTGSAMIAMGVNYNHQKNPQLPQQARRTTIFDFQQQINVNLVGTIGSKLKITTKYNTEANFDFENDVKLEYTGDEDEIIQKLELGRVSMQMPTSLITGASSLFGLRSQLRFGKLWVTSVFSQQKGQKQEINLEGGAQVQRFEVDADQYEANRHYFLNFYHRDNYDQAMSALPNVRSDVRITRIEVWVTNRQSITNTENTRNIIAFSDLGESNPNHNQGDPGGYATSPLPDNEANALYPWLISNPSMRDVTQAIQILGSTGTQPGPFTQSVHFEKLENARRLSDQEFTYNSVLGFISLNQPLNADEVLGVAYEYTHLGETYQVGEFSTDGASGQDAIFLKLLKPTITNPRNKAWDLMMKNVYSIGAYQVSPNDFMLNAMYNNPATSVYAPYLPYGTLEDTLLNQVLGLDRYNQNGQPFSDGMFDFIPFPSSGNKLTGGGTINIRNGRVYFPLVEPFGQAVEDKMQDAGIQQSIIDEVAFHELYDSTKTAAMLIPGKNRFQLAGSFKSSVSSEISLNAFQIPEGSVRVTAGGLTLQEGIDYQVDYQLGRVRILNQGILESGQPIKVSLESNSAFGLQQKSLMGTHFDYRFNKDFNIGATWMHYNEKPVTQKVNFGEEPMSNHMLGANISFRKDAPWLTKAVDWLPLLSTKEKSSISFNAEYARLFPGTSRILGDGTSYIDDFEASQSLIDLKSPFTWRLASPPQHQPDLIPNADVKNGWIAGFGRADLSWYTMDPGMADPNDRYNILPDHLKGDASLTVDSRWRTLLYEDIFPNKSLAVGTDRRLPTLDLQYHPSARGQYNYDTSSMILPDGSFADPQNRWGGIMRYLYTTDFEAANVEFVQFWVLDPFDPDMDSLNNFTGGDLYLNLGNISEDILPDSRRSYENGLPPSDDVPTTDLDTTVWSVFSTLQPAVVAFDNNPLARIRQDVGLDGVADAEEQIMFSKFLNWVNNSSLTAAAKAELRNDPSSDNYHYYRGDDYDADEVNLLDRFRKFNRMEGNSAPQEVSDTLNDAGYPTLAVNIPDVEDINSDNNLSETESYFQYRVSLRKADMNINNPLITDVRIHVDDEGNDEKWYLFKVPVRSPDKVVNGIADFRSIRFFRMFLHDFDHPVLLRFAKLELVRGEWRKFTQSLLAPGENFQEDPTGTTFNIGALNVEQNDDREPINYKTPEGIQRELDYTSINLNQLNEQSMTYEICGLKDGDARAATRNIGVDVRSYKRLKMFVHAEEVDPSIPLNDDDVTCFVRLGTDFENNYYEYELPLKVTQWGDHSATAIWPTANEVDISFQNLINLKLKRNAEMLISSAVTPQLEYVQQDPDDPTRLIKVKGNPTLSDVYMVMIGVRNPRKTDPNYTAADDGLEKCAEVWFNEMRLTEFDQKGGWAALASLNVQMADFANLSLAGNYSTPNWGSLESKVNNRQRDTRAQVDVNSNFQMGKFFGQKARLKLPLFISYSFGMIEPEFDPLNPDVRFSEYDAVTVKESRRLARDVTERRAVNLTNVRLDRKPGKTARFWDVANWTANFAWSELYHRDVNTSFDRTENYRGGLSYAYSGSPKLWEPFKNAGWTRNKWLRLIKDAGVYLGPKAMNFNTDLLRGYNARQMRNAIDTTVKFRTTYLKNFNWNRQYVFKYDLTKNIKFDFQAGNESLIIEPNGAIGDDATEEQQRITRDTIYSQLKHLGTTMRYNHDMNVTWNLPFNKIPITDWISATARYQGSFEWGRAPLGQDSLGNVIQNARTFSINGQLNLTNLYNKLEFFKKINNKGKGGRSRFQAPTVRRGAPNKEEEKEDEKDKKKKKKNDEVHPVAGFFGRLVMTVRSVSGTYSVTNGTYLPGYNQDTRWVGLNSAGSAPTTGFIFGQQNKDIWGRDNGVNIAQTAANKGWLIGNEYLNNQYNNTYSQNISARATLEPMKDLRVDLNLERNETFNRNEYFRFTSGAVGPNGQMVTNDAGTNGFWQSQNPLETGSVSLSTFTLASAFDKWDDNYLSDAFKKLRDNRLEVSGLLGDLNGVTGITADGYRDGFSDAHQNVIIGAFLTAYTGRSINENNIDPFALFPLPNWQITYDGLSKFKALKKVVKNFSIKHGYRSALTLGNFTSNLNATVDANGHLTARDAVSNDFIPLQQVTDVSISERFSPLIGMDATWVVAKNNLTTGFEWSKDRNLSLSLVNDQVTEMRSNEFSITTGYRFPPFAMPFKLMGKPVKSALNLQATVTYRESTTVIRKIVENQNQIAPGSNNSLAITSTASYDLNSMLALELYYNMQKNLPKTSQQFPSTMVQAGFRLRFTLQ